MPDFSALLRKPADGIKKPPILPAGTYHGIVKPGHLFGESKNKKTPYIEYSIGILSPGDDIQAEQMVVDGVPINLSNKQFRLDFYITPDAEWRLLEFIKSFGVQTSGRMLDELAGEPEGKPCLVQIKQEMNQQTSELFNTLGSVTGVA